MYPETLFGHVVATVEIMTGMFGMAVITGLIFIRFSRPVARIVFSDCLVLSSFNGQPALMLRVANLRDQAMAEAEFRLMLMRDEPTEEGHRRSDHEKSLPRSEHPECREPGWQAGRCSRTILRQGPTHHGSS